MVRFAAEPLGFEQQNLLMASLRLPQSSYADADHREQFYERLDAALTSISEARGVAFSSSPPTISTGSLNVMEIEGHTTPSQASVLDTFQDSVSPDYFQVMDTPLQSGRSFSASDRKRGEPVAVVNEALARKYFDQEDPLGKHIRPFDPANPAAPWMRIIGVVGNEKQRIITQEMAWADLPILYRPLSQNPPAAVTLLMRMNTLSSGIGKEIQQIAATIDAGIPIDRIQTMTDQQSRTLAYPRFRALLLGIFAAVALVLAVIGVFGLLSHLVTSRTQEIAIRVALGAQKRKVLTMILKEGLVLTVTGTVLGVIAAWIFGHYLATLLYGTKPADPLLLAAIVTVLFPTSLLAMYVPARRASKVEPVRALKCE
jgi:predicted permease